MVTFGYVGKPERSEKDCAGTVHCSVDKWIGGVLAANGKIIGIHYAAETVLEIDPKARTATTFGVVCVLRTRVPATAACGDDTLTSPQVLLCEAQVGGGRPRREQ